MMAHPMTPNTLDSYVVELIFWLSKTMMIQVEKLRRDKKLHMFLPGSPAIEVPQSPQPATFCKHLTVSHINRMFNMQLVKPFPPIW